MLKFCVPGYGKIYKEYNSKVKHINVGHLTLEFCEKNIKIKFSVY